MTNAFFFRRSAFFSGVFLRLKNTSHGKSHILYLDSIFAQKIDAHEAIGSTLNFDNRPKKEKTHHCNMNVFLHLRSESKMIINA